MRRVFAFAVLVVLLASPAQATPITVSAGEFAVFNFDLTFVSPPPPYSLVGVRTYLSDYDLSFPPIDIGEWGVWTELNGTGNFTMLGGANLTGFGGFSELNDGVFSLELRMTAGAITVNPTVDLVCEIPVSTTLECVSVPEPATVWLLASGAGAAILVRRRRVRPHNMPTQ